jgi:hypothetical protein
MKNEMSMGLVLITIGLAVAACHPSASNDARDSRSSAAVHGAGDGDAEAPEPAEVAEAAEDGGHDHQDGGAGRISDDADGGEAAESEDAEAPGTESEGDGGHHH